MDGLLMIMNLLNNCIVVAYIPICNRSLKDMRLNVFSLAFD